MIDGFYPDPNFEKKLNPYPTFEKADQDSEPTIEKIPVSDSIIENYNP